MAAAAAAAAAAVAMAHHFRTCFSFRISKKSPAVKASRPPDIEASRPPGSRTSAAMPWPVWQHPWRRQVAIYVGTQEDAYRAVEYSAGCVINCAHRDFDFDTRLGRRQHQWLHVMLTDDEGLRNRLGLDPWKARMIRAVKLALTTLVGHDGPPMATLLHCSAGKHRSGAVAVLIIMLIEDVDMKTAQQMYFARRPLHKYKDQRYVKDICMQMDWTQFMPKMFWIIFKSISRPKRLSVLL